MLSQHPLPGMLKQWKQPCFSLCRSPVPQSIQESACVMPNHPLLLDLDRSDDTETYRKNLTHFHRQGIGGVFIHPRPGFVTTYISDERLSLCKHAVRSAKALGMQSGYYDENSYPSGFVGGHVSAAIHLLHSSGSGINPMPCLFSVFSSVDRHCAAC